MRAGSIVNTKIGKIRAVPTTAQLTAQTTRVSIYDPAGMWRLRTVSASAIRVLPREHDDEKMSVRESFIRVGVTVN